MKSTKLNNLKPTKETNLRSKERGNKCEVCKNQPKILDVHPPEYKNKKECLLLVCRGCHMKIHKGIIKVKEMKGGII